VRVTTRSDTIPASHLPAILAAAMEDAAHVYEAYSDPERKIRSFSSLADLSEYMEARQKEGVRHVALAVEFRDVKGQVQTRRIALRPEKCNGATWREAVGGWGLVHVQFAFLEDGRVECRVAVNSEKRAAAWASNQPDAGDPKLWDWKVVEKHARRLIRVLRQGQESRF
jgi:hypothetical protein